MAARLTAAGVIVQPGTSAEAEVRRVAGLIKCTDPSGLVAEIFYGPLVTFEKPFQSRGRLVASRLRSKGSTFRGVRGRFRPQYEILS